MEIVNVSQTETVAVDVEESVIVVTGLMGPPGPQGPQGPQGQGLQVDGAVTTIASLPTAGTPGQSLYVAETGKIYIWGGV